MSASVKVIRLEDHFKDALRAATGDQLLKACMAGGEVVRNHTKLNIHAQGLVDTSALLNSISVDKDKSTETSSTVSIGTNIEYAAIHEFGGPIVPRVAKMLSWITDSGERAFAKVVHIPARPYLRPALDENEGDIIKAVGTSLKRQIEGAL